MWGRINWDVGMDIHTPQYMKYITNKDLLCTTRNSTQLSVTTYMGKEYKKRVDICVCITDSLCYTVAANTL